MNAAFMSLERHERGIHVVRADTDGVRVAEVRSRVRMLAIAAPS
jgi:hypothetical protein